VVFVWLFGKKPTVAPIRLEVRQPEVRTQALHSLRLPHGKYAKDRHQPAGVWVRATIVVEVAGIQHRKADAAAFCAYANRAEGLKEPYGLRLEIDPNNSFDPNAIKVFGHAQGREWHIGYVDAETAKDAAKDLLSAHIPIAAELYSIYVSSGEFIEIKYLLLAPKGYSHKARVRALSGQ